MDEQTLAMLREGYRNLGFGAPLAVLRLFDQDAPGDEAHWIVRELTSTARYRAREVVADDLLGSIPPHWQVIRVVPRRWEESDARVVVVGHIDCRPRGSWDVVSIPFAHIWTVVHGRVVSVLSYLDAIEILRVADEAA